MLFVELWWPLSSRQPFAGRCGLGTISGALSARCNHGFVCIALISCVTMPNSSGSDEPPFCDCPSRRSYGARCKGDGGLPMWRLTSRSAAWSCLLAVAAVFVMTVPRTVVAEETLAPHLMEWRSNSIAISGTAARAMILRQFTAFDPRYLEQKRRFAPQITAAAAEIRDHEERGRSLPCSTQMYLEAKWLLNSTAYFDELSGNVGVLQRKPENRGSKLRQSAIAADGGLGSLLPTEVQAAGCNRDWARGALFSRRGATICDAPLSGDKIYR